MAHLTVQLFDRVTDIVPQVRIDDGGGVLFHDLHNTDPVFDDKAARVRVVPGGDYRRGDHIRLLDRVRQGDTAAVSIDPDIDDDVDLNRLRFADKTAAVKIILNPDPLGRFRLRVSLFDRVDQRTPNFVLYDFEFPPEGGPADLHLFEFDDKAAFVILERGPDFQSGDRIILQDTVEAGGRELSIVSTGEQTEVDLNTRGFADRAAALRFEF